MADCQVCDGKGDYGVVTAQGQWWGTIKCPACAGSGIDYDVEDEDEAEDERRHEERLAAAMDIIRANAAARCAA